MATHSKGARSESRLEKSARESENARGHSEREARAVREKTARLRALRLAKEAADKVTEGEKKPVTLRKRGAPVAAMARSQSCR